MLRLSGGPLPAGTRSRVPDVGLALAVGAASTGGSSARGAISGLIALLTATAVYYASMSLVWPASSVPKLLPGIAVWSVVSVAVGPAAGGAGAVWRRGSLVEGRPRLLRSVAVGGLASVLLAEAMFLWFAATDTDGLMVAGAELVAGGLAPLVLLRAARERAAAYATLAAVGVVAIPVVGYAIPAIFKLAGSGRL